MEDDMPLKLTALMGDDGLSLEPGEVQKALSWADHITPEQIEKMHKTFIEITTAENQKKAILDNSLFFLHLAKTILGSGA
jgi:hypothetical protein